MRLRHNMNLKTETISVEDTFCSLRSDKSFQQYFTREVLDTCLSDNEGVILGGSVADGNYNLTSDLDVFVLKTGSGPSGQSLLFNEIVVDVEYIDIEKVNILLTNIKAACATHSPKKIWAFSKRDLDLLHRLISGIAINATRTVQKIQNASNKSLLALALFLKSINELDSTQIDLIGVLHSKDRQSMEYLKYKAVTKVIDAFNFLIGETNPSEKWRFKYFAQQLSTDKRDFTLPIKYAAKEFYSFALDDDFHMKKVDSSRLLQRLNILCPILMAISLHRNNCDEYNFLKYCYENSIELDGSIHVKNSLFVRYLNNSYVIIDPIRKYSCEVNFQYFLGLLFEKNVVCGSEIFSDTGFKKLNNKTVDSIVESSNFLGFRIPESA